jgi:hypothetical protein
MVHIPSILYNAVAHLSKFTPPSNTSTQQKFASVFIDQKCCTSHLRARQILLKTPTTEPQKRSSHILPIIFLSPDFLKSNPMNKEFLHTYNSSHTIGRYYSDQWRQLFLLSSHVQFLFVPPLSNHHTHSLSFYSFSAKIHSRPPRSPEEILINSNTIVAKLVFLLHIAFNPKLQEEKFRTCNAHILTTPFLRLIFLSYSEQGFEDWWSEYDHINMCLHLPYVTNVLTTMSTRNLYFNILIAIFKWFVGQIC